MECPWPVLCVCAGTSTIKHWPRRSYSISITPWSLGCITAKYLWGSVFWVWRVYLSLFKLQAWLCLCLLLEHVATDWEMKPITHSTWPNSGDVHVCEQKAKVVLGLCDPKQLICIVLAINSRDCKQRWRQNMKLAALAASGYCIWIKLSTLSFWLVCCPERLVLGAPRLGEICADKGINKCSLFVVLECLAKQFTPEALFSQQFLVRHQSKHRSRL